MFGIIIGIIGIICGLICFVLSVIHKDLSGVILGILVVIINAFCIRASIEVQEPTAMDVYQGKTTLQYTYKNGVAIDSTVVWKEEIEK